MTSRLYPAEFVLPGHPDKLCDAIADTLVQEASSRERRALCGVEVAVHREMVTVTGRIACRDAHGIDVVEAVRSVYRSVGYRGCNKEELPVWLPDPERLKVWQDLCLGPLNDGEAEFRGVADDQSIVTGYAIDLPGTNYLPPEHWLASRLAARLELLHTERPDLELGPDGKVALVYEEDGPASRIATFSTSLQQRIGGDTIELRREVLAALETELAAASAAIPGFESRIPETVIVNGAGNFAVGGPDGDNGLSGKKLVCDAYGPRVPIGGGALSGKDFYKADRAGAILARRIAKTVVMTGAASECTATLVWLPGDEEARVTSLRDGAGRELDTRRWSALFDLSLASIGDVCTAAWNDLVDIARHGHFTYADRPWERLRVSA